MIRFITADQRHSDITVEFMTELYAGKYRDDHFVFNNLLECELGGNVCYHELGELVQSWTEHNGSWDDARFKPIAPNVEVITWPWYFLLNTIVCNRTRVLPDRTQFDNSRVAPHKLFTCNMKRRKPHRDMMRDLLHDFDLVEHGMYSYIDDGIMVTKDDAPSRRWSTEADSMSSTMPPWYREVLIDVVTETKIDQTFFTEKTWKPLLGLRLPLYLHTQGCYGELKGMGFHFPDWLRVDYIDEGIDSYARCRRIIEVLNDLKDEEPAELWYAAKPTLIHNQRRAKQLALMVEPCEQAEGLIKSAQNIAKSWGNF